MAIGAPQSAGIHVPPPLLFALALGAGLLADRFVPLSLAPSGLRPVTLILGWLIVALSSGLGAWAIFRFYRQRTAIMPDRPASHLVLEPPYTFSRNPMYTGLLTLYLGILLVSNLAWAAIFGLLPVVLIVYWIIPAEERYLESRFGQDYSDYCKRVRRWL